jgi:hypothetical protein
MPFLTRLFCSSLIALPLPAAADLAQDFDALAQNMPALPTALDPANQFDAVTQMIGRLSGKWVNLTTLASGFGPLPSLDLIERACEKVSWDIIPTEAAGFQMVMKTDSSAMTVQFQFAGGATFQAIPDERSTLQRVFGDNLENASSDTKFFALVISPYLGSITVLPYRENLLLVMPDRRPVEVWGRCLG